MELSLKKYGWKCVLGTEVAYIVCLLYGIFLVGATAELHRSLFELLPGFVWGSVGGFIVGAIDLFIISWIFAWYFVWMYNTSIVTNTKS